MVVRISVFVGLLIEIWKIHKVSNVVIDRENKIFGIIPRVRLTDKGSYVQSPTKQYDIVRYILFTHILVIFKPLVCIFKFVTVCFYSWCTLNSFNFLRNS